MDLLNDQRTNRLVRAWPKASFCASVEHGPRGEHLLHETARVLTGGPYFIDSSSIGPELTVASAWYDAEPHSFDDLLEVRRGGDKIVGIDAGPFDDGLHVLSVLPIRQPGVRERPDVIGSLIERLDDAVYALLTAEADVETYARRGQVLVGRVNSLDVVAACRHAAEVNDRLREYDFNFEVYLANLLERRRRPRRIEYDFATIAAPRRAASGASRIRYPSWIENNLGDAFLHNPSDLNTSSTAPQDLPPPGLVIRPDDDDDHVYVYVDDDD